MFDLRPVGYVIGLLVAVLGATMLPPLLVDLAAGNGHWPVFAQSSILTGLSGGLIALACANGVREGMSTQQAFLLTTGVWLILPLFGALPFVTGETGLGFVDAYFEAMSGITTTGSTVITGLDDLAPGLLLWRGILQWLGGLGIVIVALLFLPVMKVGGMQFFRTESFDTFGKVLPRVLDISRGLVAIYVVLSVVCAITYTALGLTPFEAVVHAMTTISTGGFSTSDQSFGAFPGAAQYAAVLFMITGALPFVRLLQVSRGEPRALWQDPQVGAFVRWVAYAVGVLALYELAVSGTFSEAAFRERLFNLVSIFTGTGYGSGDVTAWGHMPFLLLFIAGMIGGCTGSTGCAIKVFRYQILFAAIRQQLALFSRPHTLAALRYARRPVSEDVLNSVMLIFAFYILTFGLLATSLSLIGLPFLEAVTGAWTAIFNIGPAFGELIGPTGSLEALPEAAKAVMIFAMLLGRLEIVTVLVLFAPVFWRA